MDLAVMRAVHSGTVNSSLYFDFFKLALASPYADDSWHQLRLWFLNRLQEEPLEVGRGAAFLLRLFWPLGYEVVAALP
jgi:hypothetical protein